MVSTIFVMILSLLEHMLLCFFCLSSVGYGLRSVGLINWETSYYSKINTQKYIFNNLKIVIDMGMSVYGIWKS